MKQTHQNIWTAILIAALVAGTMDLTAATVQFVIVTEKGPEIVFRYIASALFGKLAFTDLGYTMPAAGILLHFVNAFLFTLFFFQVPGKVKCVQDNAIIAGVVYGTLAWVIMNLIVVPLSFAGSGPIIWHKALTAMLILICCIGLPISLLSKKYYLYKNKSYVAVESK